MAHTRLHVVPADEGRPTEAAEQPAPDVWNSAVAFGAFMDTLGLDRSDPHLEGTELRVARAYAELLAGLRADAEPELRTFANDEGYAAPVEVMDIPFFSICAHHFLPFFGMAHVAYLPGDRVVGLSKIPRVVEYFARRPQVQERMTEQIADYLAAHLEARGVMVAIRARHLCMEMRGVKKDGATRTSAVRGAYEQAQLRSDFLNRVDGLSNCRMPE